MNFRTETALASPEHDDEILDAEHDELLLDLHSKLSGVCEACFGLRESELEQLAEDKFIEAKAMLERQADMLRQLKQPGFKYSDWGNWLLPLQARNRSTGAASQTDMGPSAPSQEVLFAATKALSALEAAIVEHDRDGPTDLGEITVVEVLNVTLQAELTRTGLETAFAGYVDARVEYKKPPVVAVALDTGTRELPWVSDSLEGDEDLLKRLQDISSGVRVAYMAHDAGVATALFTVRSEGWMLGDVLREMRRLKTTDQGKAAEIVLVASEVPSEYLNALQGQGFNAIDADEMSEIEADAAEDETT